MIFAVAPWSIDTEWLSEQSRHAGDVESSVWPCQRFQPTVTNDSL